MFFAAMRREREREGEGPCTCLQRIN